ncbi:MAG TPA: uroporphyrinogen decarboxylase family protein [Candidatus Brocadiia bacterium]|nr:uroporphyrinogen decarboxylase family protein [Candidatus Brocadiia bacterium]
MPADSGFDYEASCRRVCGVYRREPVDHIPIISPLLGTVGAGGDIDSAHFGDWRDEERFRRVARLVQRHCDLKPPYNRVACPRVFEPQGYQRFLEAPQEYVETLPPEKVSDIRTRHTSVLHTPKGDLRWTYEVDKGILTHWDMEKTVKCLEDVDKLLSVPCRFKPPASSEFDAFRQHRAAMGRNAVGGAGINSMVAMLVGVMDYELVLEWMATEPEAIQRLADAWLERVGERVDFLLKQGVGPFWHFNGVERAAPPMMGPRQWERWVVPYDGEIMRRIKAADPEARIHVHCHGKARTLIDSFVAMGVDSIDPVEPPPQGDVDIAEVKRRYDGKMVFFGNIEFLDMETRQPDEIEELVRAAIESSGKRNIALMPSAGPHERPSDLMLANAERYIEAGLKYGAG